MKRSQWKSMKFCRKQRQYREESARFTHITGSVGFAGIQAYVGVMQEHVRLIEKAACDLDPDIDAVIGYLGEIAGGNESLDMNLSHIRNSCIRYVHAYEENTSTSPPPRARFRFEPGSSAEWGQRGAGTPVAVPDEPDAWEIEAAVPEHGDLLPGDLGAVEILACDAGAVEDQDGDIRSGIALDDEVEACDISARDTGIGASPPGGIDAAGVQSGEFLSGHVRPGVRSPCGIEAGEVESDDERSGITGDGTVPDVHYGEVQPNTVILSVQARIGMHPKDAPGPGSAAREVSP